MSTTAAPTNRSAGIPVAAREREAAETEVPGHDGGAPVIEAGIPTLICADGADVQSPSGVMAVTLKV
jgi:hypothetical protein